VPSALLSSYVVCLSVRLSATLMICGNITCNINAQRWQSVGLRKTKYAVVETDPKRDKIAPQLLFVSL